MNDLPRDNDKILEIIGNMVLADCSAEQVKSSMFYSISACRYSRMQSCAALHPFARKYL